MTWKRPPDRPGTLVHGTQTFWGVQKKCPSYSPCKDSPPSLCWMSSRTMCLSVWPTRAVGPGDLRDAIWDPSAVSGFGREANSFYPDYGFVFLWPGLDLDDLGAGPCVNLRSEVPCSASPWLQESALRKHIQRGISLCLESCQSKAQAVPVQYWARSMDCLKCHGCLFFLTAASLPMPRDAIRHQQACETTNHYAQRSRKQQSENRKGEIKCNHFWS